MGKINLLDKAVYNRISAGEVVENPASVVKELVENSIDAGADSITVEIENGGIKSISVTDNGCGIAKEDLTLAVLPHATSKIKTASDLDTIATLGFRGEALASIVEVSETTIKSKYIESETGNYLEIKGGETQSEGICPMSCGTQITVRSLFYNTPARYKFLKTPKGEENNVTSLMAELIFANPTVSFCYSADGEVVFRTYGEGLQEAIYAVYGNDVGDNMIPVYFEENGYKISGYVARPATEAIKNNRTKQTFVINGRTVFDSTISAVIQNAYGEFLMKRTFPSIIIDVVMPFDSVDVNVHPNKREVRFADARKINGIIYHAVKNAVEKDAESLQESIFTQIHNLPQSSCDAELCTDLFSKINSPERTPYKSTQPDANQSYEEDGYLPNVPDVGAYKNFSVYKPVDLSKINAEYLKFADSGKEASSDKETYETDDDFGLCKTPRNSAYKIIGQAFDTYLLLEIDDTIIFLDQHAAHERILFDNLVRENAENMAVQELLLPYEFETEPSEKEFFVENEQNFEKLGFTIKIDKNRVSVYSVPAILTDMNIGAFLSEVVQTGKTELKRLVDSSVIKDKIAKCACKNAIKGGASLSDSEIKTVINYFFEKGVPLQCPHGRPTMIKFTKSEIERFFGRKV